MQPSAAGSTDKVGWGLLITVPVCVVLAVIFLLTGLKTSGKPVAAKALDPSWYTPRTARGELLKNKSMVGRCFLCHAYWVGPPDPNVVRPRFAHATIRLDHGANNRCYNCHHIYDRSNYTADDGSRIMPSNVVKLCARCHGLKYRDWLNGTHGVRRGKWNARTVFERQTFACTQCHDPHAPRFKFKNFAPPPVWPAKFVRRKAETFEH